MTFSTVDTLTSCLLANSAFARFSSKRVIAVMFSNGIVGAANLAQINALVFAGLPTTNTATKKWKEEDLLII